jgi:hypothetical protein
MSCRLANGATVSLLERHAASAARASDSVQRAPFSAFRSQFDIDLSASALKCVGEKLADHARGRSVRSGGRMLAHGSRERHPRAAAERGGVVEDFVIVDGKLRPLHQWSRTGEGE